MRQVKYLVGIMLCASIILSGCKTKELSAADKAKMESFEKSIESKTYVFTPTSASPMGYKTINLDPQYYLKVSKDTIQAYLPYFGRSYIAPIDPNNISIDFTSTESDYSVKAKKDTWEIVIKPKDSDKYRGIQLYMSVGNTGYTNLRIQEVNRQSISYYGRVEPK